MNLYRFRMVESAGVFVRTANILSLLDKMLKLLTLHMRQGMTVSGVLKQQFI